MQGRTIMPIPWRLHCIRPYHEPLVSTPLEWSAIKKGLNRYAFTMDTIAARLKIKGDLWEKLSDEKIIAENNKALIKRTLKQLPAPVLIDIDQ